MNTTLHPTVSAHNHTWINFATTSATTIDSPRGFPRINAVAQEMITNPHLVLRLTGYALTDGSPLATQRAHEVRDLIALQLQAGGVPMDDVNERIILITEQPPTDPPHMDGTGDGVHIAIIDTQRLT